MTTDKMVGRYERLEPLTTPYWIIIIIGSLLCIPGIAIPICYVVKYGRMDWTAQLACYSIMWEVFVAGELLRFALKQRHTARAIYLGGLILLSNVLSYVVITAIYARLDKKE